MLNKLETELSALLTAELNYLVNPDELAINDIPEQDFPVCFIDYGVEETDAQENIPNGYFQNFQPLTLTIVLWASSTELRTQANAELTKLKKFINQFRCFNEAVIDLIYTSSETRAISTDIPSGVLVFNFDMRYRQLRTNPESL